MNNFPGQATDANGNTPDAVGPVLANAGDGPGGTLRGMPMKLVQAAADLCIAGLPKGRLDAEGDEHAPVQPHHQ